MVISAPPIFTPEQVKENRGRIAIFIDGANLLLAASLLGIEIDYLKLLCRLTDGSRLLRCFFYTGVESRNEKQQRFLLWLRRHGYRVVAKEVQPKDGCLKASLNVEIAVDLMALASFYDTAVLVCGNSELAPAVNAISYRGVRIELVSLRKMTSDSLLNVSDRYIDLESIKEDIHKTPSISNQYGSLLDRSLMASPPKGH